MNVLIIRSARKGYELRNLLSEQGFVASVVPLIDIGSVDAQSWRPQFEQALTQPIDGLIFVSLNAIDYFMRSWTDFKRVKNIPCFAVGSGTADELTSFGFQQVHYPRHAQGSEALLELPELQQVQGKRFLIIRGTNGRELIGDTLKERGASVEAIITYTNHRRLLSGDELDLLQQDYDAIVVSSSDALRYLVDLKKREHLNKLDKAMLVVMSDRQEQIAGLDGFKYFMRVSSANNNEVLTSLSNYRKLKLTH